MLRFGDLKWKWHARVRTTNAHGDEGVVERGAEVGRVEIAGFGEQHVERREDDPAHDVKAHDEQ